MKIKSENALPVVVIAGRPNIGKSSLFNCLLRRRVSIVHEESGVTRDRVTRTASFEGKNFLLVDTGGLGMFIGEKNTGDMDDLIREQLLVSVESADIIIFLTDASTGITSMDEEVANFLRKTNAQVILAANKADNEETVIQAEEFHKLGFKENIAISCQHKTNLRVLSEMIGKKLPETSLNQPENPLRISVAGRPNVGKSSIINSLLGEERVIVSDIAGTTRDAVDIPLVIQRDDDSEIHATLVDTAGVKKRKKINNLVEMFSMQRTEEAIKRSDIVVCVIDIHEGVTTSDKKIFSMIKDAGKPCIIAANKWDLVKKTTNKTKALEDVHYALPFLTYAPVVFCSAHSGENLKQILPETLLVHDQSNMTIPTPVVNKVIQDMMARVPPTSNGKGILKVYYSTMISNPPAKFLLFINKKIYCNKNYLTYLTNQLRKSFSLSGLPIEVELKEREHQAPSSIKDGGIPGHIKEKLHERRKTERRRTKKYRK